jgi:hypothetical protein
VHGFFHVRDVEGAEGYAEARMVKADEFLREQVVAGALSMLRAFKRRMDEFDDIPELRTVKRATEQAVRKLSNKASLATANMQHAADAAAD